MSQRLTDSDRVNGVDWGKDDSIEDNRAPLQGTSADVSSIGHTASDVWTSGNAAFTALNSVVSNSIAGEDIHESSVTSPATQIFTSPLHRQILFSVANNFAGLGAFSTGDVIRFLLKETNEKLYQLILTSPGYSSQAIAQNLFKGAIEGGDARIVNLLLNEKTLDVGVNQLFLNLSDASYTLIERASALRHRSVVEVLLRYGADVIRTHSLNIDFHGALDCAVSVHPFTRDPAVDFQIFQMLLDRGGDLSERQMQSIVSDGKLVSLIMSAHARKNVTKWSEWGVFHRAIKFLDDQTAMDIVQTMIQVGADLNCHIVTKDSDLPSIPTHILDVAAQRASLGIVEVLLKNGASLTGDTLPYAVASGNENLIQFLLDRKADINSIGELQITPLAAAIRLQNARVFELFGGHDALARLEDGKQIDAALLAASEVGDIPAIERSIHVGGKISPTIMGFHLRIAIRNRQDEVATRLIDAGADVNTGSMSDEEVGPSLFEALKRHSAALVYSLLDAGANPNYDDSRHDFLNQRTPAIALAAEWGNHAVVKDLILAGADVNACSGRDGIYTALTIAVKKKDAVLVEILLSAEADINNFRTRIGGGTALEAAAENGDLNMACYLLDQGADPDDAWALSKASQHKNQELLDLILDRHSTRYPRSRMVCGSLALSQAIQKENVPVVKRMIEKGVRTEEMTALGIQFATPLGQAIIKDQNDTTKFTVLLLLSDYNPNSIVSQVNGLFFVGTGIPPRSTALIAAVGTGNACTVQLLIRHGAHVDVSTRGRINRTPLQKAAEVGSIGIVELLVNHGANVNAPAAQRGGGTALQLAAIGGYAQIAITLLNLKADVDAPGSKVDGRTALEGAAEHGRLDMVQILLNAGAGSGGKDRAQFARAIDLAK